MASNKGLGTLTATAAPAGVPLVVGPNGAVAVGGATLFTAGKPYRPRAATQWGNAATWAALQPLLAKGPQTGSTLVAAAHARNHATGVAYFVRRGYLVVAK